MPFQEGTNLGNNEEDSLVRSEWDAKQLELKEQRLREEAGTLQKNPKKATDKKLGEYLEDEEIAGRQRRIQNTYGVDKKGKAA
jgi:hypothetical protein